MILGSLATKKCRALDDVQNINKRKNEHAEVQFEEVIFKIENESDSNRSNIQIEDSCNGSPRKDIPIKSTFEETRIPDVTTNISDTCVNIDSGAQPNTNTPEKA